MYFILRNDTSYMNLFYFFFNVNFIFLSFQLIIYIYAGGNDRKM